MAIPRRRSLLATALLSSLLVVPAALVGTASPASATPCPPAPVPCIVPPSATTAVAITGTAKVGEQLTATPPVWDQDAVTTTYQWTRDDADITGATSATYTLVGDDFEASIKVVATGTGFLLPGTSTSTAVFPTIGPMITPVSNPVVTGAGEIGGTLTASTGQWGDPEPTYKFQWYRSKPKGSGATKIEGATQNNYTVTNLDAGRKLIALVTAERFGYQPGIGASNTTPIAKANAFPVITPVKKTIKATERGKVRVAVQGLDGGLVPTGFLKVMEGQKVLVSVKIAAAAEGKATMTLPRLAKGKHTLVVRYLGDSTYKPVTSSATTLTVTK